MHMGLMSDASYMHLMTLHVHRRKERNASKAGQHLRCKGALQTSEVWWCGENAQQVQRNDVHLPYLRTFYYLHMQLFSNSAKLYTFAPQGTAGALGVKVSGAKRQ